MREAGHAALDDVATLEAALSPLAATAEARRRQARRAARAAIGSSRFQRLLLTAGAARDGRGRDGNRPAARTVRRSRRAARTSRAPRCGACAAACASPATASPTRTPAERHAFRIAAKKLRYATEFFAPWFPGKRARDYRRALTALQDVLGRMNDAAVAAALAAGLAGPSTPVPALFTGWTLALTQAGLPSLERACRRMRSQKPFWNE